MGKFENLLNKYNMFLAFDNRGYRVSYSETPFPQAKIILSNSRGISSYILTLSDDSRKEIIDFFKADGVNLEFNNTGNTFFRV